jgi:hypothetical protein
MARELILDAEIQWSDIEDAGWEEHDLETFRSLYTAEEFKAA